MADQGTDFFDALNDCGHRVTNERHTPTRHAPTPLGASRHRGSPVHAPCLEPGPARRTQDGRAATRTGWPPRRLGGCTLQELERPGPHSAPETGTKQRLEAWSLAAESPDRARKNREALRYAPPAARRTPRRPPSQ